jgi:hypothetical protein
MSLPRLRTAALHLVLSSRVLAIFASPLSATLVATLFAGLASSAEAQAPPPTASPAMLWYRTPAASWNEALPIGNGRLGAMVFGGVAQEHLQLNEETLWSGGPYDPVVTGAAAALPEIRRSLCRHSGAHDLFGRRMMGVPYEQMKYQPLGDLLLTLPGHADATDYRSSSRPVVRSYRADGVIYAGGIRQRPDKAGRTTADRPGPSPSRPSCAGTQSGALQLAPTTSRWMSPHGA